MKCRQKYVLGLRATGLGDTPILETDTSMICNYQGEEEFITAHSPLSIIQEPMPSAPVIHSGLPIKCQHTPMLHRLDNVARQDRWLGFTFNHAINLLLEYF